MSHDVLGTARKSKAHKLRPLGNGAAGTAHLRSLNPGTSSPVQGTERGKEVALEAPWAPVKAGTHAAPCLWGSHKRLPLDVKGVWARYFPIS